MRLQPIALGLASLGAALALTAPLGAPPPARSAGPPASDFANFESHPVHPLALTPGGQRLLALNVPDGRLAVFAVGAGGALTRQDEIPVGLEPCSVAAASDSVAWVVNQGSDDVSIVNLNTGNVTRSLRVGDEPADVVFAKTSTAPGAQRLAFVTIAGESRVQAYDPSTLAPVGASIAIASDMPMALAVSADSTRVYALAFESGDSTTVIRYQDVQTGGGLPAPSPTMRADLPAAPKVGLIVRHNGTHWVDETGKSWDAFAPYTLADQDLVVIDAATRTVTRAVTGVGTLLFNLAVHPTTGKLWVTNTAALNAIRFEPNLRGQFVRSRVSVVDPATGAVAVTQLNAHIDYTVTPGPPSEVALSLAQPTDVRFLPSGAKAYVAALGSNKVGVLDGATGVVTGRIAVGQGPVGLAVGAAGQALYVLNRFDDTISIVNPATDAVTATVPLGFDPTPDVVRAGRPFLYDASLTSGHGDASCASCHAFANFDDVAWDLGNPQGNFAPPPPNQIAGALLKGFHPMKGPMVTQTLRGLGSIGLMHWRADRANFLAFDGAFMSLLGRSDSLSASDMTAYRDFVNTIRMYANPNRLLDRSLTDPATGPSAVRGQNEFMNVTHDGPFTCNNCHLVPTGTNDQVVNAAALLEDQDMKVPQLRNAYQKDHMSRLPGSVNRAGFGFTHDGTTDNLVDFLKLPVFTFAGGDAQRADVAAFVLAFDTGTAPAVGRRLTLNSATRDLAATGAVLDTLYARAAAGDCDLVVLGRSLGLRRGWLYNPASGDFGSDRAAEPRLSPSALRALAGDGSELTWYGVAPGTGSRVALDRDRDGYFDRDELDAGSDPGNPQSTPANVAVGPLGPGGPAAARVTFAGGSPNPFPRSGATLLRFTLPRATRAKLEVFDAAGRRVATLVDGALPAGPGAAQWNGRDASGRSVGPGVYFYRLSAEGEKLTSKGMKL
jgi:YVTN family beta-propeller protein